MKPNPEIRTEIYFKKSLSIQRQLEALETWQGSERNKELIRQFQKHLFVKTTKNARVSKLSLQLRKLADRSKKDFDRMTYLDIESAVAQINTNPNWTEITKSDYRRCIKSFYRWFEERDPRLDSAEKATLDEARKLYSYVEKHVKSTYRKTSLDYSGILTEEDARLLVTKGCSIPMERGLIAILHETGARVGELLNMRIRDIEHKSKHSMVRLDGKTGERRVPIIQSVPWLLQWITDHPHGDNPNALLWVSKHNRYHSQPIRYFGVCRLLQRVFAKAGLTKKCNPHWFRHSRATILAPRYSEAILCKLMGWTLGSDQVRTYVHLGAGQVEDEVLRENGLLEVKAVLPSVAYCVCGSSNTPTSRYCFRCGNALSVGIMLEDEQRKGDAVNEAFVMLQKIMGDPKLQEEFMRFKASRQNVAVGGKIP